MAHAFIVKMENRMTFTFQKETVAEIFAKESYLSAFAK